MLIKSSLLLHHRYIGAENLEGRKPAPLAAELPAGLLSWIKPVWCYKESDVIDLCGLDVAVFFRLLQLGTSRDNLAQLLRVDPMIWGFPTGLAHPCKPCGGVTMATTDMACLRGRFR